MEWLVNNWQTVLFVALLVIAGAYGIMAGKVNEWLKAIVAEVEKDLGSGTGQLKLRKAYEKFVAAYPVFKTIVPFALFQYWVDEALKWLAHQLETNTKLYDYVGAKKDNI